MFSIILIDLALTFISFIEDKVSKRKGDQTFLERKYTRNIHTENHPEQATIIPFKNITSPVSKNRQIAFRYAYLTDEGFDLKVNNLCQIIRIQPRDSCNLLYSELRGQTFSNFVHK